ncbi:MAG: hypothetical protein J5585_06755 [Clostridia bacterium]|nr:hypothetical protein [Clostridia bacterium]
MRDEEEYYDNSWYREYLSVGEYVKWSGKSEKKTGFNPTYLFLIPFMTVWCGGVIMATVSLILQAASGEGSYLFLLFMIPFWAGGTFFVYTLFIQPYLLRKYTKYAVTNKKVIQYYRGKAKFINLDPLPLIQMSVMNKYGYGSVSVGGTYNVSDHSNFFPMLPGQNQGSIVISNVKDPAKVYNIITNGR